jgi:hypothetical protein
VCGGGDIAHKHEGAVEGGRNRGTRRTAIVDFIRFYSILFAAKILKCVAFAQENRVGATISNVLNVVGLRTRNGTCSVR